MKALWQIKLVPVLAVAVTAVGCLAQDQPASPPPPMPAPEATAVPAAPVPQTAPALPPEIAPGSPLAEVLKMVQAGVDVATIQSYIANSQSTFDLDADKILYLKDAGVPNELINAMMDRDKVIYASSQAPQPAPAPAPVAAAAPAPAPATVVAAPAPVATAEMAPPPAEVTVNYFYQTLNPYGNWVEVEGYGRCWRPTVVVYDNAWSPYGDRGHWVYTDYGWYWDSDYSWGATFHYGRWFRHAHYGWCWYPDTVWAPSWVVWRSGGDYCGWAPLPPFAVYHPGAGFYYRGVSVGVSFDFGLSADCFMFVSAGHFCDRRPREHFEPRNRITEIYHNTTIINNYNVNSHTVVNRGIDPDRISRASHHQVETVRVNSLPNATKQGFRGEGWNQRPGNSGHNNTASAGHGPGMNNNNGGQAHQGPGGNLPNNVRGGHGTAAENANASAGNTHPANNNNTVNNSGAGNGIKVNRPAYNSAKPAGNANAVNSQANNSGTPNPGSANKNNNNTVTRPTSGATYNSQPVNTQPVQGGKSGYQTDAYRTQTPNRTYTPSAGNVQYQGGQTGGKAPTMGSSASAWQNRSYNNNINVNNGYNAAASPHGAEQLQQRSYPPQQGGYSGGAQGVQHGSAPAQSQPQAHATSNGGNGGGGNPNAGNGGNGNSGGQGGGGRPASGHGSDKPGR